MNNKGFTLVELLVVIAIIAIVGVVSTPFVLSMIESSKDSTYNTLVNNIETAAIELYQEKDYMNTNIYWYDSDGSRTDAKVDIVSNSITVNLQTLVGNGFLVGSDNKVILEPYDNKNIGMCEIIITKVKNGSKVCYKIEGNSSDNRCPTTEDFGGDSQCIS